MTRTKAKNQLAVAATNLIPLFAEEARKRMVAGKSSDPRSTLTQGTQDSREGKAVEHAAKTVGVGATTVFKAARIKREHPERIKEIEYGRRVAIGKVAA